MLNVYIRFQISNLRHSYFWAPRRKFMSNYSKSLCYNSTKKFNQDLAKRISKNKILQDYRLKARIIDQIKKKIKWTHRQILNLYDVINFISLELMLWQSPFKRDCFHGEVDNF